jgi:hypothetical protein
MKNKPVLRTLILLTYVILAFNLHTFGQDEGINEGEFNLQPAITNVSCFGSHTGAINLTPGTPFSCTYEWSNGMTTEDISELGAGYYEVFVTNEAGEWARFGISLEEFEPLQVTLTPAVYANGFNVTCHFCDDGGIDLEVSGGNEPYTFQWTDGDIGQSRTSLPARSYQVIVTDASGCQETSESVGLNSPERDDWRMTGNSGSNASTNFIGTIDNNDLFFRTNNIARLKLGANGTVTINNLAGMGSGYIKADNNGMLFFSTPSVPWETRGNDNIQSNVDFIGTLNNADFVIKTNVNNDPAPERLRVTSGGRVGINGNLCVGCSAPSSTTTNGLVVAGNTFLTSAVGIGIGSGLTSPVNNLDVGGSVAIGSTFAGNNLYPAPANGLLIEGSVGIGTSYIPSGFVLAINGTAISTEFFVKRRVDWPDYVFKPSYKLSSINDVESYVRTNNHLPGMPSAAEIEKDGQPIGKIQLIQQQKIEELFLYIINLEKRIQTLEAENQTLKK